MCEARSSNPRLPLPSDTQEVPSAQDVELKTSQEALDGCCPHQGDDQLELQVEEEDMNQSKLSHVDSLLSLDNYIELLSLQMENMLEASLLEDTQVTTSSKGRDPSSSQHNISVMQTLCHCFSPHDATPRADHPTQSHSETRHLQRHQSFPQQSSNTTKPESLLHGSNSTGLVSAADIRNLLTHDDNFDEIKLLSLALEEGFDPTEAFQLFEEPGSDLGLFLNSSHSTASYSVCSAGAVGHSSDVKPVSLHGFGAVGGHSQEHSKNSHVEYPGDSEHFREATPQQFLHNTHDQLLSQAASTPEHHEQTWMKKPNDIKDKCHNSININLSSNEYCAKALKVPFLADEIVSMPVDSFNSMLAKNHLTGTQVSLLRDIRRRGKNKVAAQNCRKRKLNAILSLEEDVSSLQRQKESLKKEHSQHSRSISQMKQKLNKLYHDIFRRLRDDQGRPVNPWKYIIHCSSDGSVLIMPKNLSKSQQKQKNKNEQNQN